MPTLAELIAIQTGIGPRKIETPELNIEQYAIKDLIELQRLTSTKKVSFNSLSFVRVKPTCPVTLNENGCNCES